MSDYLDISKNNGTRLALPSPMLPQWTSHMIFTLSHDPITNCHTFLAPSLLWSVTCFMDGAPLDLRFAGIQALAKDLKSDLVCIIRCRLLFERISANQVYWSFQLQGWVMKI